MIVIEEISYVSCMQNIQMENIPIKIVGRANRQG